MALLKFLGAESGALQEFYSYQANISVDTTVSANSGGARSYKADGSQTSNTNFFYDLGGLSGLHVALRWRATFSGAPAADRAYRLGTVSTSGGTSLGFCNIQHQSNGVWRIYLGDGAGGSVQGTPYEWNYVSGDWVDIQFYINKNGGWIKINGVEVYTLNTTNILWTTGTIDRIAGLSFTASDTGRPMWIDDYCVADADMGGQPTVIARQFSGNSSTYNAWSAVGGANKYSNVSETPFSATNAINNAGTTAAAQTFTVNSFASTETGKGSGTIGATSTFLGAKLGAVLKTSAASQNGSAISLRRRISSVDTDVAFTITTSDVYYDTCAKAGASNFAFTPTLANLNGGEYGVVHGVTTLSRTQTCEDLWVHAAYVPPTVYTRTAALTASGAVSAAATRFGNASAAATASGSVSAAATKLSPATVYNRTAALTASASLAALPRKRGVTENLFGFGSESAPNEDHAAVILTPNSVTAPNGQMTAHAVVENTTYDVHNAIVELGTLGPGYGAFPASDYYTFSLYLKPIGNPRRVSISLFSTERQIFRADVYLSTGEYVSAPWFYGGECYANVELAENGFYRFGLGGYIDPGSVSGIQRARIGIDLTDSTWTFTGDGTSGYAVWGFQVNRGTSFGEYVKEDPHRLATLAARSGRQNIVANPDMSGAVVGTLGSGGSLPTTWDFDASAVSCAVEAFGTLPNGESYIDLRLQATSADETNWLWLGSWTDKLFAGQKLVSHAGLQLIGGSATGVTQIRPYISTWSRSGGWEFREELYGDAVTMSSTLTAATSVFTLTRDARHSVDLYLTFDVSGGATIDTTIRLTSPQFEISDIFLGPIMGSVRNDAVLGFASPQRPASAALAAAGTLAADASVFTGALYTRDAGLAASASLATAATRTANRSGALTVSGTVAAARIGVRPAAAASSASGSLSAVATRTAIRSAAVAGQGVLAAQRGAIRAATASLTGAGSMASAATRTAHRTASLAGAGSSINVGGGVRYRTASLAASATLASAGTVTRGGVAILAAAATLAASATRTAHRTAALSTAGSVTAPAIGLRPAASSLTGAGTATVAATRARFVNASLTASASLEAQTGSITLRAASLTGAASFAASGLRTAHRTGSLAGAGSALSVGGGVRFRTVALPAAASLTAATIGLFVRPATLPATGTVAAAATRTRFVTASLASAASLTPPAARRERWATATLAASANLAADRIGVRPSSAALPSSASLAAQITQLRVAAVVASGAVTATALRTRFVTAAFASTAALSTDARRFALRSAAHTASASLSVEAIGIVPASAALSAAASLASARGAIRAASASLASAGSSLSVGGGVRFRTASVSGAATLAASWQVTRGVAATCPASARVEVTHVALRPAQASLTASATLAVQITRLRSASLAGAASLVSDARRTAFRSTALAGAGTLASAAGATRPGTAALVASGAIMAVGDLGSYTLAFGELRAAGSLAASTAVTRRPAAQLAATATAVADPVSVRGVTAPLIATANLAAAPGAVRAAAATLSGFGGTLSVGGSTRPRSAALIARGSLAAAAVIMRGSTAAFSATAIETVVATRTRGRSASLAAQAQITAPPLGFRPSSATLVAEGQIVTLAGRLSSRAGEGAATATMAAEVRRTRLSEMAVSALGSLAVDASREAGVMAVLEGTGDVAVYAEARFVRGGTLAGAGVLEAVGTSAGANFNPAGAMLAY